MVKWKLIRLGLTLTLTNSRSTIETKKHNSTAVASTYTVNTTYIATNTHE